MYDDVYKSLVQAGVAKKSDDFSFDYNDPLKTIFHLTHPEMCLVVDEIGSSISQKGDEHIVGKKYRCERDTAPREQASHNDKHFTLLGLIALYGKTGFCQAI